MKAGTLVRANAKYLRSQAYARFSDRHLRAVTPDSRGLVTKIEIRDNELYATVAWLDGSVPPLWFSSKLQEITQ